jgi:hypothetical protein
MILAAREPAYSKDYDFSPKKERKLDAPAVYITNIVTINCF